jgi:hypothetical protein
MPSSLREKLCRKASSDFRPEAIDLFEIEIGLFVDIYWKERDLRYRKSRFYF